MNRQHNKKGYKSMYFSIVDLIADNKYLVYIWFYKYMLFTSAANNGDNNICTKTFACCLPIDINSVYRTRIIRHMFIFYASMQSLFK